MQSAPKPEKKPAAGPEKQPENKSDHPHEDPRGREPLLFRMLRRAVIRFSPEYELLGTEKLPPEACILVGNHAQMYGPIAAELFLARNRYIWCIGEMMNRKEVPAYAFRDFWSKKPRWTHWFYHLLSHLIAPLAEFIFKYAHTIPVYHDMRILQTLRQSIARLQGGADIVIFPEKAEPNNGILCHFQENFVELATLYYRRTGAALCFVPMYTAPRLARICFGDPVRYCPENDDSTEKVRVCAAMTEGITRLARELPEHVVIPYLNIPKKDYPLNTAR